MAGNRWSKIQEATGNIGEALMRIAMLSDSRRYRAEQLARQGRLDVMAQSRIDRDEQMLAQSVQQTQLLTGAGERADARASARIMREQGEKGLTPDLSGGGTMAQAQADLGRGVTIPWNLDLTTSTAYQARGAANEQAQAQARALAGIQTTALGERATELGGLGLDVAGRPLGGPAMITMNGRQFPDTPEGRADALAWREQVEAIDPNTGNFAEALAGITGAEEPQQGGNWLTNVGDKVRGLFGGRGDEQQPGALMPGQQPGALMPGQQPIGDSGLSSVGGLPPGVTQDQIDALIEEGYTEEDIMEWLRTR